LLTLLTGLACCWMTLFGSAAESATYVLLAPVAAWAVVAPARVPVWVRAVLLGAYALLLAAQVSAWFPAGRQLQALGVQPLGALLLLAGLLLKKPDSARPTGPALLVPRLCLPASTPTGHEFLGGNPAARQSLAAGRSQAEPGNERTSPHGPQPVG